MARVRLRRWPLLRKLAPDLGLYVYHRLNPRTAWQEYDPDSEYKKLRQYNINVKAGADTINNAGGLSKHHEKQVVIRVQLVSDLAGAVLQDIRQAMLRPANGDDF